MVLVRHLELHRVLHRGARVRCHRRRATLARIRPARRPCAPACALDALVLAMPALRRARGLHLLALAQVGLAPAAPRRVRRLVGVLGAPVGVGERGVVVAQLAAHDVGGVEVERAAEGRPHAALEDVGLAARVGAQAHVALARVAADLEAAHLPSGPVLAIDHVAEVVLVAEPRAPREITPCPVRARRVWSGPDVIAALHTLTLLYHLGARAHTRLLQGELVRGASPAARLVLVRHGGRGACGREGKALRDLSLAIIVEPPAVQALVR
mmetsp:Transcript_15633/g.47781  ORF Transcript_15633/g.47781 Transcript_15633/m.47781 type:complete len:268 (-) Transcript_15633:903-1706(-)